MKQKRRGQLREFELVKALRKASEGEFEIEKTNDLLKLAADELESLLMAHAKNPQKKKFVARTTADYDYTNPDQDESQEHIFKELNDAYDNRLENGDSKTH